MNAITHAQAQAHAAAFVDGNPAPFDMADYAARVVGIAPKLAPAKPAPKSVESFNDDDVYIYNATTKEIARVIPANSPLTIGIKHSGLRVRAGETWDKGLSCKRLGLWIRRQDAAGRTA